jgi:DNA polymerase-3 subunit alpha
MATVLSRNLSDIKEVTAYMNECRNIGISVLGPDINESMIKFSTNKNGDVRFGLAAIKGVGGAASEAIVKERKENGPYKSIYDFMERVNFAVVNRKSLENIAYAGGFDSLIDFNRSRFFAEDASGSIFLDTLVRYGQRVQQEKNNAQQSLFGMFSESGSDIPQPKVPAADDWTNIAILNKEKEVIGLYLSAHPLNRFDFILNKMCQIELGELDNLTLLNGKEISVAGVITSVTPLTTQDGRRYARFILEDYNTSHEFTLWSKDYERFGMLIEVNTFLFIRGKVQPRFGKEGNALEYKILSMQHLAEVSENITTLRIELDIHEVCSTLTDMLHQVIKENPGKTNLQFTIVDKSNDVKIKLSSKKYRIATTPALMEFIQRNELNYFINI